MHVIKVWCPWCNFSYEATAGVLWTCPTCSDAFWDPYVTSFELFDLEMLLRTLAEMVPEQLPASITPTKSIWVTSFVGARTAENVDHFLIAFDNVCAPSCEPRTDRYREYVEAGAITLIDFGLEAGFGYFQPTPDYFRAAYGDHSNIVVANDVWPGDTFHEFNQNLRQLAAICASTHFRSLTHNVAKSIAHESVSAHDLDPKLVGLRVYTDLYNFHRQVLLSQLFGLTSSLDAIAGGTTRNWLLHTMGQVDIQRSHLVHVLLDEASISIPRNLTPADLLDFRSGQACRKLRSVLDDILQAEDRGERQTQLLLSAFRAELRGLDETARRYGQIESVIVSGLAAAAGFALGGLAGAVAGSVAGPASANQLADMTRAVLGRKNWAYFFNDIPG